MATLQSGSVYLSVSADSVSKELVRATRGDDPDRLRQIHQAIETGNDLWRSWALANSGDILSMGGTELRLRVPTEKLKDVAELRRRYAESIGSSVSVGFGTKLSEADQALQAAQKTGGDQILMYSPKIADLMKEPEEPIQKAESLKDLIEKTKQRSERMRHLALTTSGSAWKTANGTVVVGMDPHDRSRWRATRLTETGEPNGHSVAPDHESALKIAYGDGADVMGEPVKSMKKGETGDMVALVKADDPGMNKPAAGGGMTAPQEPSVADAIAPTNEASEHSENEALREQMAVGGDVQNPADDIHGQLGQMATQQAQQDDQAAQQQQAEQDQATGQDDMRKQVVTILKVFKDRAQELEGLQEQDPELYQSLTGMLQVMIQMSKEYFGGQANEQDAQQVAKSEDLAKALPRNPAENQANMEHESVLQDTIGEKGQTFGGATLPKEVKVGKQTRIGPQGNLRKQPFSMASHGRTMDAERANVDKSGYLSSRSDNLDSLENEVRNDNFTVPSFRNRLTWWFGHEHASADRSQLPIGGQDRRNVTFKPGESYLHATDLGGRHIYYHLTPTGAQEVPDSNGGFSGHSTPDLVDHINKHTAHLRNSLDPNANQFGTDTRHQAIVDSSAENIPNAQEMQEAMLRSPIFRKRAALRGLGKADLMPGGKGDDKSDTEFDHDQLAAGIRTEAKEHGLDLARAKEIAKDHLSEDPKYYTKLATMEKAWPKNEKENQANATSHEVLRDVLEERGAAPVHPRSIPSQLEAKVASLAPSDGDRDAHFSRVHAAGRYNRTSYPAERAQLLTDPAYAGEVIPELPASHHWSGDGSVAFGERGHEDDRADRDYWGVVDSLTGKESQGPVDQSDLRLRSPILKRAKKLGKAALEAGKTGRHQVNYPVGTQIDGSPSGAHDAGELKVRDPATGKTKWRSVRAGIVMSPDGSPTSSRNPGGSGGGE